MQSNYSDLPHVMSVADAKTFATQRQETSEHLLVYRGANYTVPKQQVVQDAVSQSLRNLQNGPLSTGTQLHYRGASYTLGTTNHHPMEPSRVTSQSLKYRGITYIRTI